MRLAFGALPKSMKLPFGVCRCTPGGKSHSPPSVRHVWPLPGQSASVVQFTGAAPAAFGTEVRKCNGLPLPAGSGMVESLTHTLLLHGPPVPQSEFAAQVNGT